MDLTEDKKTQLDGIVQQMIQNKESDENIQTVVNDFKSKYTSQIPSTRKGPYTPEEKQTLQEDISGFFKWPGLKEAGTQFIKGTTPALGIAGAGAASLISPSPVSPALGYTAGERLGKTIETLTGVSKPETPVESAVETAKSFGIGMLPYGVEKGIGAVSKVPSMVTRPWTKAGKVKGVFESVGGELEPSLAGQSAIQGAKETYETIHRQGNQLYESAKKLIPAETKINSSNTYQTIDMILKDPASSDAEKALASKFLKKISPSVRTGRRFGLSPELQQEILEKAEGELGVAVRPLAVEEAYTIRSELSKLSSKTGKVGWRSGQILDSLHQDLNEGVTKLGVPQITEDFQKAISFWRDKVIPQRKMVTILEKRSPELISQLQTKTGSPKYNLKTISELQESMSSERFQDVKRGWITDLWEKSDRNPVKTNKALRNLLVQQKENMEKVLSVEELEAIHLASDPTKLGRFFEEHPKTKWLAKFIGYGAMYSTLGYGALRHLFGFHM